MDKNLIKKSKLMSLVLRHKPEEIGVALDDNGWCDVVDLISKSGISHEELNEIVETNEKKRFAFNDDRTMIRASQGHSIDVDLELKESQPPSDLFHGTTVRNTVSIMKDGILKGKRQYVHLSISCSTAVEVGKRHGKPVVITILADKMYRDGYKFYLSDNNVWLTEYVPVKYLLCDFKIC